MVIVQRFRSPETIGIMTRHRRCRRRRCPRPRRHPRRDAPVLDRVDTGGGYWHSAGPPGLFTYKLYKYYFRANRPVDHYETPGGKFQRILLVPLSCLPLVHTHTRAHIAHIRMPDSCGNIEPFKPTILPSSLENDCPIEIKSIARIESRTFEVLYLKDIWSLH